MRKAILLSIIFLLSFNVFSIETYKIEKGRFKSNTSNITTVTPNIWLSWQNMDGKVTLDESSNKIVTYFNATKTYIFFKQEYSYIDKLHITTYYTRDNYILSFYENGDENYLHIEDLNNKFELYYKINKIK